MLGHRVAKFRTVDFRERLYRRRFIVPNMVTVGNLFCGFLAIIYAATARYEQAAIAIFVAIVLDGLDGRVARRLNATSKFGVEFDSFSDLVSFGFAPALLVYFWGFRSSADQLGVVVGFLFALCAAARLARFNIAEPTTKSFTGLPTPGSAGVVAAMVHFMPTPFESFLGALLGVVMLLPLAALNVSTVPYLSVKELKVRGMPLLVVLAGGLSIALVWYNSAVGLLALSVLYAASGPALWLWRRGRSRNVVQAGPPSAVAS